MKLKALLLVVFVAGLTASFALADNGRGKGGGKAEAATAPTTEAAKSDAAKKCRPSIELEVKGAVAAAPTASALSVLVSKGGAQGAGLAGKQVTFDTSAAKAPSGLKQGDAVQVHGRACVDLVAGTVKLVATHVSAKKAPATTSTTITTSSRS